MAQSNENAPVSLASLPIPQLTQIKKQLDEEVQHLSLSFQSLRGAQFKFKECLRCIRLGLGGSGNADTKTVPPSSSSPSEPSLGSKSNSGTTSSNQSSTSAVNKSILVPLTPSLYVPGVLAPPPSSSDDDLDHTDDTDFTREQTVMVDIGTGYFVDKTLSEADDFYTRKISDLETSLSNLDNILKTKTDNLRVVEEVLRQKLFAESTKKAPAAAAAT